MSDNTDLLICASASFIVMQSLLLKKKKKARRRRWWVTSIFRSRQQYGGHDILRDLSVENVHFKTFCRMSPTDFDKLINLVGPKIAKKASNFRKPISVEERLALTLRFLASGDSYSSLSFLFKISKQAISLIVPEVCDALIACLADNVCLPKNEDEWRNVAKEYEEKWNFPHCIGAMDGKHVVLQAPMNSGSDYINYKSTFSIVLLALVDANYCFLYANVGCQGRISDGGVFRNTSLYDKLQDQELHLPEEQVLTVSRELLMPYVIVADDAFPLHRHIMKPYPGAHPKGSTKRIFNYSTSRAWRIIENVFAIMSAVFRVLRKPILLQPKKAQKIVLACVYLHNYLRKSSTSRNTYTPPGTFDTEQNGELIPGNWRQDPNAVTALQPLRNIGRKSSQDCQAIRNEFADYFINEGKVPWQDDYA